MILVAQHLDVDDNWRPLLLRLEGPMAAEYVSPRHLRTYGSPLSGPITRLTTSLGSWEINTTVEALRGLLVADASGERQSVT